MSLEERFWSKVDKKSPDECWPWTASKDAYGYGAIGRGTRQEGTAKAHVVSWELHNGPVPAGKCVCHSCDVRECVNPDHLWLGTQADNQVDKKQKRVQSGEGNSQARLTELEVAQIRGSTKPDSFHAQLYGVTPKHVQAIRAGRMWKKPVPVEGKVEGDQA